MDKSELSCAERVSGRGAAGGAGSRSVSTLRAPAPGLPLFRTATGAVRRPAGGSPPWPFRLPLSLSLSMSLLPRQQKVDDCVLAGWLRGAERREVTLATCGCQEKASGEPPGSAGEVAQPRAERWPFLIFIIMHIDSGDGAERQPPALVKPILEIPDKPCPLANAAGFGWRGGCGASVG